MRSKNADIYRFILLISDLLTVAFTWVLAFFLRFHSGLAVPSGLPDPTLYLKLIPFLLAIWSLVTLVSGSYHRIDSARSRLGHLLAVVQTSLLFVLGIISFSYFYEEYRYSRLMLMFFSGLLPITLLISRSIAAKVTSQYNLSKKKASGSFNWSGRLC